MARLAAARATASDLKIIAGRVEAMRQTVDDLSAFAKADLEFHHSLAEAAGNRVLIDQLHVVRSLLQVYADRAVHDDAEARVAIAEHDAVHAALVAGDEDAAASADGGAYGDRVGAAVGRCVVDARCLTSLSPGRPRPS